MGAMVGSGSEKTFHTCSLWVGLDGEQGLGVEGGQTKGEMRVRDVPRWMPRLKMGTFVKKRLFIAMRSCRCMPRGSVSSTCTVCTLHSTTSSLLCPRKADGRTYESHSDGGAGRGSGLPLRLVRGTDTTNNVRIWCVSRAPLSHLAARAGDTHCRVVQSSIARPQVLEVLRDLAWWRAGAPARSTRGYLQMVARMGKGGGGCMDRIGPTWRVVADRLSGGAGGRLGPRY